MMSFIFNRHVSVFNKYQILLYILYYYIYYIILYSYIKYYLSQAENHLILFQFRLKK